jgi:tripartite-type tricarboxylate transporter receptor subunit TctC
MGSFVRLIFVLGVALGFLPAPTFAQDFAGKTIEIVVPYDTGGATDLEARAFARVLPALLPGKPTVIVRNMPGGGGLIGVNYMGEIAKPDGLSVIMWTWSPVLYLTKDPGLRVPLGDFFPVGGLYFGDINYIRTDALKNYKGPADIQKLGKIWFGGLGPSNTKDVISRLQMDLLGMEYGYLGSYRGSNDIYLAVQKGEVQYTAVSSSSWRAQIAPQLETNGTVKALFQGGMARGDGTIREPGTESIPTFEEFYRQAFNKEPTGEKWEMYKVLRAFRGSMSDVVLLPPKTPAPVVAAYRQAFSAAVKDPQFIDDYQKLAQSKPLWLDGPAAQDTFDKLRAANDPKITKFLDGFINEVVKK